MTRANSASRITSRTGLVWGGAAGVVLGGTAVPGFCVVIVGASANEGKAPSEKRQVYGGWRANATVGQLPSPAAGPILRDRIASNEERNSPENRGVSR